MKNYSWWLGRKHKVRKKYHLLLSRYISPKELKEWQKLWKYKNASKKSFQ